jgi:nitroreductase
MKIKSALKGSLPYLSRGYLKMLLSYWRDANWFFRQSRSNNPLRDRNKSIGLLRIYVHSIEKGLSLPEPRPGFGQPVVANLLKTLKNYIEKYGIDPEAGHGIEILREYRSFHGAGQHFPALDEIDQFLKSITTSFRDKVGSKTISRAEILKGIEKNDFRTFVETRHSIRDFADEPVPVQKITEALELSLKTPSACNRQPWKVYLLQDRLKERALDIQGSCRGFRSMIDKVLLITSTLSYFNNDERHEAFIDGGMFAMSLIYALHAKGIGSCSLNAAFDWKRENELRRLSAVPENEALIMLVAIGNLKEKFNVARSVRVSVDSVLEYR